DPPNTAGADFDTHLGGFKWTKIAPDAAEKDYTFGTDYTKGDRLKKSGKYYVARKDFKAGAMDDTHWMTKGADKGAWNTSQTYAEGELVLNGGTKYICTTAGPAGASFQAGNFMQIVGPIINYVKDRDFALGNQSKEGSGPVKVCKLAHKSGTPEQDIQAKRLVEAKVETQDWDNDQKDDFLGQVNKGIVKQIEGPSVEGKFRFGRDAKPYTKIYIRAFPQWFELAGNLSSGVPVAATGGAPHFK